MNFDGGRIGNDGMRQGLRGGLVPALWIALAVVAAMAVWQAARAKVLENGLRTSFGPAKAVGAGTARSYVTLENGLPVEIGFELQEEALRGLPATAPAHPGHHMMVENLLELPAEAKLTPFKLLELDWNPAGHVPDGVYSQPHFDFHFFMITRAERDAIRPADAAYARKAARVPGAGFIPKGYILPQPLDPVPQMGMHWVDAQASEFHGVPFTQTFIHGSWDGRMIFYEPMIAKGFLESRPNLRLPIAPASCYQPAGYHPTAYNIQYDRERRRYRVSLSGFQYRGGCEVLETILRTAGRP